MLECHVRGLRSTWPVIGGAAGGELDLHDHGGDPLYVRELLLGVLASGALVRRREAASCSSRDRPG